MAQRAGVSFELERLDLEGDELVVTGHWSGVRGLRFVRPTLVAEDRRILATLEHKPWAPSLDRTWIAAFPWDRDDVDVGGLALAVGSQVTVSLGDAPPFDEPEPAPEPEPEPEPAPEPEPEPAPAPEPEPEPAPDADADGADPDQPIGVRTMPAARTVMAELQRPTKPASKLPISVFDLWVIRVLGTVAAGCFILLLVSILRVFV
jgi:hypothetical protein